MQIFSGQAGGHIGDLAGFIGEVLGASFVPIQYEANGRSRSVRFGNVGAMAIEGLEGQGGGEVTITNHPVAIAPGNPAVAATSKSLTYNDHGYQWEISGKNGFYSPFSYAN
jgi:hypothetical protein